MYYARLILDDGLNPNVNFGILNFWILEWTQNKLNNF